MEVDLGTLINQLPNSQYGIWIRQLFNPEGGNAINILLSILNMAYIMFAIFYAAFQYGLFPLSMMRTGELSGGKGGAWGIVRTGLVFALLFPDPNTGFNSLNKFALIVGSAGYNVAQKGWSEVREAYFDLDSAVYDSPLPDVNIMMDRMIELQTCAIYARIDHGRTDFTSAVRVDKRTLNPDVLYRINFNAPGTAFNGGRERIGYCGFIEVPNLEGFVSQEFKWTQGQVVKYQKELFQALQGMSHKVSGAVGKFAMATHPRTGNAPNAPVFDLELFEDEIAEARTDYTEARGQAFDRFKDSLQFMRDSEFLATYNQEWIHAGGFWNRLSSFGKFHSSIVENSKAKMTSPQWERIWPDPPHHFLSMRTRLSEMLNASNPELAVSHTAANIGPRELEGDIGFIEDTIVSKVKEKLSNYMVESVDFEDPVGGLVSRGYSYLGMYAGIIGVVGLISVAFTPAVGLFAWNMLESVRGYLKFAGLLLVIGLPMVPYIVFTFGIISWLMPLIFFFFTGPLWLIPNIRADSTVLIVGNGWTTLVEIFLRPIVLLLALAVAHGFFVVIGMLLEVTLGNALTYAYHTFTGLLVFAAMSIVYGLIMMVVAVFCFLIIVILPNQLAQALPQEGATNA